MYCVVERKAERNGTQLCAHIFCTAQVPYLIIKLRIIYHSKVKNHLISWNCVYDVSYFTPYPKCMYHSCSRPSVTTSIAESVLRAAHCTPDNCPLTQNIVSYIVLYCVNTTVIELQYVSYYKIIRR